MKQSVVDRCVDDLAYTFGISRSQLNVVCHHSAVPQDSTNFPDCRRQRTVGRQFNHQKRNRHSTACVERERGLKKRGQDYTPIVLTEP
jgi:hypothetical protein